MSASAPPAGENAATLDILARTRTLALLAGCTPAMLDFDDPARQLPSWAHWRTLRQMAWHIADTESRYYLPQLGLPTRAADSDLMVKLRASAEHVRGVIQSLPAALVRREGGQVWTSTKLLRRLAWHEREELIVTQALARRAAR